MFCCKHVTFNNVIEYPTVALYSQFQPTQFISYAICSAVNMSHSLRDLLITFHVTLVTKHTVFVSQTQDISLKLRTDVLLYTIWYLFSISFPIERISFYIVSFGLRVNSKDSRDDSLHAQSK